MQPHVENQYKYQFDYADLWAAAHASRPEILAYAIGAEWAAYGDSEPCGGDTWGTFLLTGQSALLAS